MCVYSGIHRNHTVSAGHGFWKTITKLVSGVSGNAFVSTGIGVKVLALHYVFPGLIALNQVIEFVIFF